MPTINGNVPYVPGLRSDGFPAPPRARGILIHLGGQALGFLTEWLVLSQNGLEQPYGRFPGLSDPPNHAPWLISLGFDASAAMQMMPDPKPTPTGRAGAPQTPPMVFPLKWGSRAWHAASLAFLRKSKEKRAWKLACHCSVHVCTTRCCQMQYFAAVPG